MLSPARRILVAIRDAESRNRLCSSLVSLGYDVTLAETGDELVELSRINAPHLMIADLDVLVSANQDLTPRLRALRPSAPLVVLPCPNLGEASDSMSGVLAASGVMAPPELVSAIERVLGTVRPPVANGARKRVPLDPFVGQSAAIRQLAEEALQALGSDSPILIEGETGSGKGVLAAWLHRHGPRAHEPFVDLNCAGFSRELMDSELFGHERGAFTGAVTSKPGLLEVADKGTLFLDEIGDMEAQIQAKLLKVIEERRFRRVGETRERQADVRIIAATHHDLQQAVRDGRFRADLYYRIHVLRMRMPALRHRSEDLPALARRILSQLALDLRRVEPVLSPAAEQRLREHPWPGNLRELRNELERGILRCEGDVLEPEHLRFDSEARPGAPVAAPLAGGTLEDVERAYIERVLQEEQRVEAAAQKLGIPRSTLYQKIRALGIALPR